MKTKEGRLIECETCQSMLAVHSTFLQRIKCAIKPATLLPGPDGEWLCQKHHRIKWKHEMDTDEP